MACAGDISCESAAVSEVLHPVPGPMGWPEAVPGIFLGKNFGILMDHHP